MNITTLPKSLSLFLSVVAIISFESIVLAQNSEPDAQPTKVQEYGRLLCGCLEEDSGGFVHADHLSQGEKGDALFSTNCRGIRGRAVRTVYRAAQQACEGDVWSPKKSPGCYLAAAKLLNDQLLLDEVTKCKTLSVAKQEDCFHDAFFLREVKINDGGSVQTKPLSPGALETTVMDRCQLIPKSSKEMCPAGTKASGLNEAYKLCTKAENSGSSSSGSAATK